MHWHLSLVSLALVSFPTAGASQAKSDRPNVIFLMIDQVRTDALGAYGGGKNASTPHIDRLAREGVVFTNAISSTPLCTPYRGMLMTGHTYVKWLAGKEELYDNVDDRYQMKNLVADPKHLATLKHLRQRMAARPIA